MVDRLLRIFLHLLPACIIDAVALLRGHKPYMVKIIGKMHHGIKVGNLLKSSQIFCFWVMKIRVELYTLRRWFCQQEFGEFPQPAWAEGSHSSGPPAAAGGTPQILVDKTSAMSGRLRV